MIDLGKSSGLLVKHKNDFVFMIERLTYMYKYDHLLA